jgi:heme/copper-type cytochrome/quinol oxidase subunit 2
MSPRLNRQEVGLSRTLMVLLVIVVVAIAAAGVYLYTRQPGGSGPGSSEIQISIKETDPVNQIDSFVPQNVTATQGTSLTFVVQNGDDEPRVFSLPAFAVNQTISAGTTSRISFSASQAGTFKFTSYATIVLFNKTAPILTGYLTVTP